MRRRADRQKEKTGILDPIRSALTASARTRLGCSPPLQQPQRVAAGFPLRTPNLFEKTGLAGLRCIPAINTNPKHAAAGLWSVLMSLGRERWPRLLRADAESRGLAREVT